MTAEPVTSKFSSSISELIVALLSDDDTTALDISHDVLMAARVVIDDALGVHAHWETTSRAGAMSIVKGQMRRRYPELTEEALHALAVHSTRDFRRTGI